MLSINSAMSICLSMTMHYSEISITSYPESVTLYHLSSTLFGFYFTLFRLNHFCWYDVFYVDMILQPFQQNMLGWITIKNELFKRSSNHLSATNEVKFQVQNIKRKLIIHKFTYIKGDPPIWGNENSIFTSSYIFHQNKPYIEVPPPLLLVISSSAAELWLWVWTLNSLLGSLIVYGYYKNDFSDILLTTIFRFFIINSLYPCTPWPIKRLTFDQYFVLLWFTISH